jgi:hypothetical protein
MTTLHDRLADLADEAPTALPAPGLWDRGRRYHRRRRAGTLAVVGAAVVVLATLGGVSWQRSAPQPAPATGSVGLPDRVWTPSPWLPDTDAPGRLVAITTAARGAWTGMQDGVAGISATTGEYAFLDLPDAELEPGIGEPVLSPDGRQVAYWLTGETTGSPNSASGPVTGVGVLDTETGRVTRHWISTPHGLSADILAWADARTVVFEAGQYDGGDDDSAMARDSGKVGSVWTWSPGSEPQPLLGVPPGASFEGAAHGRVVLDPRSSPPGRPHQIVEVVDPNRSRFVDYPDPSSRLGSLNFVAPDASGHRLAVVPGSRNPNYVVAGAVGELRRVPNSDDTWGVVDWLDSDTIVTLRRTRDRAMEGSALYRVSVSTGESHELVRFPASSYGGGWKFATDLLGAPSVHADEPPRPLDPRWVAGLSLFTVLSAGLWLLAWRRRVQP